MRQRVAVRGVIRDARPALARSATASAAGPETRSSETAPTPVGVARAAMVVAPATDCMPGVRRRR